MAKRLGRVINILEVYATSSSIDKNHPDYSEYKKECAEIWKAIEILHSVYHQEVAAERAIKNDNTE